MILRAKKRLQALLKRKKKALDGYVHMYEYGKDLLYSTYECACTAQETTISKMKDILYIYKSEIKKYIPQTETCELIFKY